MMEIDSNVNRVMTVENNAIADRKYSNCFASTVSSFKRKIIQGKDTKLFDETVLYFLE